MQQRFRPFAGFPMDDAPLPVHFGAHLRLLRDRHGLSQREIVAHLAGWQQAAYSKVEKGTRAPLFEELPRLYRALKEAGVQLTRQDREHFYLLARDLLESRKTRHTRQSDEEWHALYARLAAIDGLPATKNNLVVPKTPQRNHLGPIPRREIGHLLGREAWLASIIDLLVGPSQIKVLILQGPPGCGKTSELHRLTNHILHRHPRSSVVLCEPAPIQLERIEPADVLEQLLGDVLEGISSAHTTLPATSLQARVSYVLDSLTRADCPAIICLDNAEHLLDAQGQIEAIWQRFLTQFAQINHQAVLVIVSQEWPVGTFLAESQLVRIIDVPLLSQREGSQLLQTLGVRNAPAELLGQAVTAVGGMPVCLEWLARLVREPFLRDEWTEFEEGDDDNNVLLRLLSDPALFGGSVAQRVQPLLDRVLKRLSVEATTALQDLAVTPIPLGAPALKALYQSPRALRELRESSLLVAYPQRIQLLPMVAAQVRKSLTDAQVDAAEERLIQALNQWLRLGLFHQRESGNLVAELAVLQLKHEQVLETAHLLVRYGWAAFNAGHGPRLARLVWETLLPFDQESGPGSAIARRCGSFILLHYLAPFCDREPGRSLVADYQEVLSHIRAGAAPVQPSFEVHVLHHLLLHMLNKGQFEEAEALWKSTYERLAPYLAENSDLHASLLERQAYGAGRWSDWLNEQSEQEAACTQLNRALVLYQQCVVLLDEREEELLTLEASIRRKRRARVLNNLGYRLNSLGRYQEAKEIIEQSILLKEQGFTEVGALASSYGEMAQTLAGLGEYQQAFQYSDKALEEVQRLARAGHQSSQEEVWVYLVERGKLHWIVGQPELAERLLREARLHIHERRRIYRMTAQHILDDLEQWKHASSSSVYRLDWRWIDELRRWVSFPLYEWLDPAGPLTQEQHQQIALLMDLETEEAREQRHTIIRRSQQEEVNRALAERRNPRFCYPAIPLEKVQGYIESLRELDARISQEEPNVWVKEWYHGTIDEHLSLLYLVEATATGDDARFWSCIRRLFPEPGEEEQQEALTFVQQMLSQAFLREETRETVQDTMKLFSEQFGIAFDLTLQPAEARNDSVAQPLTPPPETGSLVSALVSKQFFERMFEQHGYTGWQVVLSIHTSSPYADSAARQLVLPVTEQSIKQILSIYEHAVLDHVESTVAGEQSRLGLLGIGLPGYTLSREGSALYQQRQAAERAGKPFDDSMIWAGTLGILLACRVVDSSRSFFWVYLGLQHVFYLYRRLRRPDQNATIAKEKAHEIALKYCLQLYRGKPHLESEGCWTKAVAYQRGLHLIERAVAEDPAVLEYLALGKMAIEHIPHLQALQVLPSREAQHQKEQEKHDAEALLFALVAETSREAK